MLRGHVCQWDLWLTTDLVNFKQTEMTNSKVITLKQVQVKDWILYKNKIYIFSPSKMGVSGSIPFPFACWTLPPGFEVFSLLNVV